MTVLVLAPHADDAELGAGATISKMIGHGHEVIICIFGMGLSEEHEAHTAAKILSVTSLEVYNYVTREFPVNRQHILDKLCELKEEYDPKLIMCPSTFDTHQDHQVITNEAIRCFKMDCTMLGYEMPWNNVHGFEPRYFVDVTIRNINKKVEAIEAYASQQNRQYTQSSNVIALAMMRGLQIKTRFAEAFEVIRILA